MKCVLFAINACTCEMLIFICTKHASTTLPVNETPTISIKSKVLIKFGASVIMYVELRVKKLQINQSFAI